LTLAFRGLAISAGTTLTGLEGMSGGLVRRDGS
jgi:hypothetical protein